MCKNQLVVVEVDDAANSSKVVAGDSEISATLQHLNIAHISPGGGVRVIW